MKSMNIKRVSILGMLVALAMILSFVETLIPIVFLPGMKLGLANLVVIVVLYLYGVQAAVIVSFVRIFLVAATFGNMSTMLYSIAGASLSLFSMILAKQAGAFSMTGISILGGITHNFGQILFAAYVSKTSGLFSYFPLLCIAGVVSGFFIGLLGAMVIQRTRKVFTQ